MVIPRTCTEWVITVVFRVLQNDQFPRLFIWQTASVLCELNYKDRKLCLSQCSSLSFPGCVSCLASSVDVRYLARKIAGFICRNVTFQKIYIYFGMRIYRYEIGKHYTDTYRGLIFEASSFIPQELILMCKANQSFSVMIYKCIEPCTFISKMSTFQSPSAKFSTCAILIMDIFVWKQDINRIKDFS